MKKIASSREDEPLHSWSVIHFHCSSGFDYFKIPAFLQSRCPSDFCWKHFLFLKVAQNLDSGRNYYTSLTLVFVSLMKNIWDAQFKRWCSLSVYTYLKRGKKTFLQLVNLMTPDQGNSEWNRSNMYCDFWASLQLL